VEMSLLHAGLAAGAALAAIPVILHLFMRQTPKHVVFPALQLIRERQKKSRKRLKVKNWLLLLARMAILALMALALARPRVYSEAPLGDESAPMAVGLVFDTSLSMGYVEQDKTRLDLAKERAYEILAKAPESSQVFVVDSAVAGTPSGLPPASARKIIDSLTIQPVNRPLNAAMGQVYAGVSQSDRPIHVVYVLTDLARTSWVSDQPAEGLELAVKPQSAAASKIATFVMSLRPQAPTNLSIEEAKASSPVATDGEPLVLKTVVRGQGTAPARRTLEFYLDDKKRGEQQITVPPGGQVEAQFETPPKFSQGFLHRAEFRLTGEPDPLPMDDRRYLTFRVRPPLKVLLVADSNLDSEFVAAALDPDPNSPTRPVRVERVRTRDLTRDHPAGLTDYAAVFLLNALGLDNAAWSMIAQYVRDGGGLVVGLGARCDLNNYNQPTPSQVLPARLIARQTAQAELVFGKITDITHPLFDTYGKDLAAELALVPVVRYWKVTPSEAAARVLLAYSNGDPALIERAFQGQRSGRVLLWTTPLAQPPTFTGDPRSNPDLWNLFPNPGSGWSFLVMMDRTVNYLAGVKNEPLAFEAGESVVLNLDPRVHFSHLILSSPDGKQNDEIAPSQNNHFIQLPPPRGLGQWKLIGSTADNQAVTLGFSVNPPVAESRLAPLATSDLDVIFGKEHYQLSEDVQTFKEQERTMRLGHEIFPWLLFLILLVITLENTLANLFYKEAPRPGPVRSM